MNTFAQSVSKIIRGALKAFLTFPASIGCALAFAVVTMIRIQLDWPQQEPFNFLFNCLHWSFAMGGIFSKAAITAAQSRFNTTKAFIIANLLGAAAAAITFLGLYLFSDTELTGSRYAVISDQLQLVSLRQCLYPLLPLLSLQAIRRTVLTLPHLFS
jgi:hypothetical protein